MISRMCFFFFLRKIYIIEYKKNRWIYLHVFVAFRGVTACVTLLLI